MKYFIVADVHGFFNEMMEALDAASYDRDNPNHTFVSLGDLFDRGPDAKKCLEFVMSIPEERRILIRGNHEDLLEDMWYRGCAYETDSHNGTDKTACQLTKCDYLPVALALLGSVEEYRRYRYCLEDYHETETAVFVHGYLPQGDWRNAYPEEWKTARWYNGMQMHHMSPAYCDKTIYCGHWHSSYGWCRYAGIGSEFGKDACHEPFTMLPGLVALDACTVLSGKVNCVVVEEN